MSEQNKALFKRTIEEVLNQRKLEVIGEVYAANFVLHDPSALGGKISGPQHYKRFAEIYLAAFPDLHFTINDQIADGDKVVTRWTATGTHRGALMSVAPTGNRVTMTGISISRVQNGKLVEGWGNSDTLGILQQLGVIQMMGPAGTSA